MKVILTQATFELRSALRNGEQLLINLVIPIAALIGLHNASFLSERLALDFDALVAGTLAMSLMGSAFVSTGIGVGFDRFYGVLKRYRSTPLTSSRWIAARVLATLGVQAIQLFVITGVALTLGWSPKLGPTLLATWLLGTTTFVSLALCLASRIPAMANLAICNGLYLALVATSGMVIQRDALGGPAATVVAYLPGGALAEAIAYGLNTAHAASSSIAVLACWAIGAAFAARALIRWE